MKTRRNQLLDEAVDLGGPNSLDRSKAQLSETLLQSAVH
jgi:hypothetical protein